MSQCVSSLKSVVVSATVILLPKGGCLRAFGIKFRAIRLRGNMGMTDTVLQEGEQARANDGRRGWLGGGGGDNCDNFGHCYSCRPEGEEWDGFLIRELTRRLQSSQLWGLC